MRSADGRGRLRRAGFTAFSPLLLVLVALGVGCESGDGGGSNGPDMGPPPRVGICTDAPGDVSIVGQWAAQAELDVRLTGNPEAIVALCPDPQIRPSRLTLRAVVTEAADGTADVSLEVCSLDLPSISGGVFRCPTDPNEYLDVQIASSEAFANLLPTLNVNFSAPLPVDTMAGASFEPDPFTLTMGANLMDDEPLPRWDPTIDGCDLGGTTAMCVPGYEALYDQDGDANLGVTLLATTPDGLVDGQAYVAVRIAPQFSGQIRNANCIDGTVALNLDFSIVDSSLLVVGLDLDTAAVIDNIPPLEFLETSYFKLLRADANGLNFDDDNDGTVTCAEIVNNEGQFQR